MIIKKKTALRGGYTAYYFIPSPRSSSDLDLSLTSLYSSMSSLLFRKFRSLKKGYGIKFQVALRLILEKYSFENEKKIVISPFFPSEQQVVLTKTKLHVKLKKAVQSAYSKFDAFVEMGSGWVLRKVKDVSIALVAFQLFRGGCGAATLPASLVKRKCCFGVRGVPQDRCFLYAVAAALCSKERNRSRNCGVYERIISLFCTDNISFPIDIKGVKRFDKNNIVSVNVYGYDGIVYPLYLSEKSSDEYCHANVLLWKNHFYCISDLARLVAAHTRVTRRKCFVCNYCLSFFASKKSYTMHQGLCRKNGTQFHLPSSSENVARFQNYRNMIAAPFVIYCDMETMIAGKVQRKGGKMKSSRQHVPISVGAVTVCRANDKFSPEPFLYTGLDCIDVLFKHLHNEVQRICYIMEHVNIPCRMTKADVDKFNATLSCYMCNRPFESHPHLDKVRDHCHLSGKFRYTLCSVCNLTRAKEIARIPVFFHGFTNYDSHFLIQKLSSFECNSIHVIPRNAERFLSFSLGYLCFKDSYQFLGESLSVLAQNLKTKSSKCFRHLKRWIHGKEERHLLMKKGIFPYSYFSDISILQNSELPPKECFRNDLTGQDISEEEYQHALLVWKLFNCKIFQHYLEIYLKTDCLLLADIFENFRDICIRDYGLDPCHYFSSPHFTYDAFLRFSQVSLELLSKLNHYLFITRGIRGGLSMVSHRYAAANHRFMRRHDPNQDSKFLIYLDANNLYGWSMKEPLPYRDFRLMSADELTYNFIMSLPSHGSVGCIVECTLAYPQCLHDDHSDYPLAPVKMRIPYDKLSPTAKAICDQHKLKKSTNAEKLLATLDTRVNYVLHYRNLQLYLRLGMKLVCLHNGLIFKQAPFLRSYVEFNSKKRAEATNSFDIAFYKLLTNSLYGKMMENPEKRTRFKLCNTENDLVKCASKFNYKRSKRINQNLVGVEMKHPQVKLDKPYYVGMSILDLSKLRMYQFHYDVMKATFGNRARVLYTDTDSLIYEITSYDVYSELQPYAEEYFDFSNFPSDHPLKSDKNKRVPGTFKDECAGRIIAEFVGLRSKMYSLRFDDKDESSVAEVKVAKGVSKPVVVSSLRFQSYLQCLFGNTVSEHEFNSIRSFSHQVYTTAQSKVSLSPFEDKRYLLDMIHSAPYGHYSQFC